MKPRANNRYSTIFLLIMLCSFSECNATLFSIFAGDKGDESTTGPILIYSLTNGADQSTLISTSFPSMNVGILGAAAMRSDGTGIVAGDNISTGTPIAYLIPNGAGTATPITFPNPTGSIIQGIAIDRNDTAILVGGEGGEAFIYRLPLNATTAIPVAIPSDFPGNFESVAIDPNNGAILAGTINIEYEMSNGTIAGACRLAEGAMSAVEITLPEPTSSGDFQYSFLTDVAVGPQGLAFFVGSYYTPVDEIKTPLMYRLAKGSMTAERLSAPNANIASLHAVAIDSLGRILICGEDTGPAGTGPYLPLIYSLSHESSQVYSIQLLELPAGASNAVLNTVAIRNDRTAIFGGSYTNSMGNAVPLIYTLASESNTPILIANPSNESSWDGTGYISSVEFDGNGDAIFCGTNTSGGNTTPLVFRLSNNAQMATFILPPEGAPTTGQLYSVGSFSPRLSSVVHVKNSLKSQPKKKIAFGRTAHKRK